MTEAERAALARTLMGYGLGLMTERTQRGLPNAELTAAPEIIGDNHGLPAAESVRDFLADEGPGLAAEMTGVPAIVRGAGNIARGYEEGDLLRGAAGAGEMALGVAPGGSLTGLGRAILSRILSSPGRALAATTAASAPMLATDAREARAGATGKARAAVEGDPQVAQLRARLRELQGEHQRILSTPIKGLNKASADASRERRAAPLAKEIEALPGRIQAAEQGWRENAPFRDRYPGVAELLLYGGGAAAAGIPFLNTVKGRLADRYVHQPAISRQADKVDTALRGETTQPGLFGRMLGRQSETVKPNQAQFESERDVLARMLQSREAREPSHLGQMAAGTGIMMEARMIPEEIDAIAFPPGHPTREQATDALTTPGYYLSGAVPSILAGASAAHAGNTVGRMVTRGERPDMDRTRGLADALWKGKAPAADSPPSRIDRIKDAATERLVRILQQRDPPAPGGSVRSAPELGGTPAAPIGASPPAAGTASSPGPLPQSQPRGPDQSLPSQDQPERRPRSSDTVRYEEAHSRIAREVLADYLRTGKVPERAQMRADLQRAFAEAGAPLPDPADLARRVTRTHPFVDVLQDAAPEAQARALGKYLGKGGFLAVPAAVGAGASLSPEADPQGLARALLNY